MKYDDEGRVMVSAQVTNPDRIVDADGDTYALAAEDYLDFFAAGTRYARVDANGLLATEYFRHYGDPDTYLRFDIDRLRVVVGGVDILDITEAGADTIVFNNGEADVDFRIAASGITNAFFVQGSDGKIGIGTSVIPHGGVGAAMLALDGVAGVNGPNIQITTTVDDYPLYQTWMNAHDSMGIIYDGYNDGAWKSSDAGSNFAILKYSDILHILYDSGIAQGGAITWNDGIVLDTSGNVGIGTATHGAGAAITLHMLNTATDPGASANLMHIYCQDRAAGVAQFCLYQEEAVQVEVDEGKMSHKIPVRLNGSDYYIMLCVT